MDVLYEQNNASSLLVDALSRLRKFRWSRL